MKIFNLDYQWFVRFFHNCIHVSVIADLKEIFENLGISKGYDVEIDRWKEIGQRAFDEYNANHTPEKCFEYYYNTVMKYTNK